MQLSNPIKTPQRKSELNKRAEQDSNPKVLPWSGTAEKAKGKDPEGLTEISSLTCWSQRQDTVYHFKIELLPRPAFQGPSYQPSSGSYISS